MPAVDLPETEAPASNGAPSKNGQHKRTKQAKPSRSSARARPPRPTKAKRARKEGLRLPQIRILKVLSKADAPMPRSAIVAKVTQNGKATSSGFALGPTDTKLFAAYEKQSGYKCLHYLGYVKVDEYETDSGTERGYSITAAGRKALTASK